MNIDPRIRVYGTIQKGECPTEDNDCKTIVNQTKINHPETMLIHIKNEGRRTKAQMDFAVSMGFIKGASDYLLVGNPMGFIEIKRADYSHKLSKEQEAFLIKAQERGAFVAVALGWRAGLEAIAEWRALQKL